MLDSIKNNQFKFSVLAALLLLPIALMYFETQEPLRYHAWSILNHEYWRYLSGHWVHLTWGHLWMNWLALLILIISFYENLSALAWLLLCIALCLLTTLAFILFSPELRWYVGLSGILHGLFIYLILQDHKLSCRIKSLFIIALSVKLIWEQIYGAMPGSVELAGGNVVVDAHLYGAVAGIVCFLISYSFFAILSNKGS